MRKGIRYFLRLSASILVLACATPGHDPNPSRSLSLREKIQRACYEVVVRKPTTDSLTYEKALPYELLQYHIRNDEFAPMGTAFAISETELVTAAHVLQLLNDSKNFTDFYIRDAEGAVYPIEQLLSFHNERDFIRFSVKGKTFDTWFETRPSYEINEAVFAVGNIYGQGLVGVPGTLLGTLPEPVNGRWVYLKSSPPNDSGSSGGPLLDQNGNAIGIIIAKDNNFSYSLPIGELNQIENHLGVFHKKFTYHFALFPESTEAIPFDQQLELPEHYQVVRQHLNRQYLTSYRHNFETLFQQYGDEIFPRGASSRMALNGACHQVTMQVLFKDPNDRNWYFSDLQKEHSALDKNGAVRYANLNDTLYVDLEKPDDLSVRELYENPDRLMDTILKGINIPREFAEQEIRILSLGKPFQERQHIDAYGRKWMIHLWSIEYCDEAAILLSTPTPDGAVAVLKFCPYGEREIWLVDLMKTADFVYIPYYGTLRQWSDFLAMKPYLYGSWLDADLQYETGKRLHLEVGQIEIDLNDAPMDIADKSVLAMLHDFYPKSNETVWGLRKLLYSEEKKGNYFVVYRHIQPNAELPDHFQKSWENLRSHSHPYNGVPYVDEGRTNIGIAIAAEAGAKPSTQESGAIISLYLAKEGSIEKSEMQADLQRLRGGLNIHPETVAAAAEGSTAMNP